MKKNFAMLIVLFMLITLMSACSNGSNSASSTSAGGNTETSAPASVGNTEGNSIDAAANTRLKIGVSYPVIDTPWTVANSQSFIDGGEALGLDIILTNAENSAEKQLSDIEDLISRGCDCIYIYAVDTEAIGPAIDAIKNAGRDCVIFNREVDARSAPNDYRFMITGNCYEDGVMCAAWLAENYKNHFGENPMKVVHITGPTSASDANLRSQGFLEVLQANYGDFEVVATQSADWLRVEAQKVMQNIIQSSGGDFNVVYAHNNEMALGAIAAMKQANIKVGTDVIVVTIDTTKETVKACIDGDIEFIVSVPPVLGEFYLQTYLDYRDGNMNELHVIAPHAEVDRATAEEAMVNGIAF